MKTTIHYKGHRWSQAEIVALMAQWSEGKPPAEIAEGLKVSPFAVGKMVVRLRKQGIPLKRRTRGHVAGRANQPWTQGEIEYLIRQRGERATMDEIAMAIGRTPLAIAAMIQKLRGEHVQVPMFGNGVRRLYDMNALRATFLESTPGGKASEVHADAIDIPDGTYTASSARRFGALVRDTAATPKTAHEAGGCPRVAQ